MTKLSLSVIWLVVAFAAPAQSKPRVLPNNTPAPVQPAANRTQAGSSLPWLHWMLEQDGGPSAVAVTWPEMVQAATGHQVIPFKAGDPVDTAAAARISSVMDGLLPELNRSEGLVRSAKRPSIVPSLVEDELQTALSAIPGWSCEAASPSNATLLDHHAVDAYPAFRLIDQASHRTYYLGISFYPTGQRDSAASLLHLDPSSSVTDMPSDGACLLVCLEHNNKPGHDLAFLNWELIDLAPGKVRARTSFQALTGEVILPAATIGDGRRGRD